MGKIKKKVRNLHEKAQKVFTPVGYRVAGKQRNEDIEGFTDEKFWADIEPQEIQLPEQEEETPVMPVADEEELAKARRRRRARQSGRVSTVLTGESDGDGLGG